MPFRLSALWQNLAIAVVGAVLLAGCQESDIPKQLKPVPHALSDKMRQLNMSETGPIFVRIYKESSEIEIWKQQRDKKFALLTTYSICKWSGALGPKKAEGDRQAPEGFYTVTPGQMNPKSNYYLAFNIGYPNAFDRSLGRTGSNLMVHGACSSAGCYSLTDEDAGQVFALARDSFRGGQRAFQIQAFPFRMTPQNMAKHRDNPNFAFWQVLKTGSDYFELTHEPPKIDVCNRHYVFNADAGGRAFSPAAACPPYTVPEEMQTALAAKQKADEVAFATEVTRLKEAAANAAEEQKIAEAKRIADEAEAAAKQAAKEARAAELNKKLGVFARILGRDTKAPEPKTASAKPPASVPAGTTAAAFAPATVPLPPKKPAIAPATVAVVPPQPVRTPPPAPAAIPPVPPVAVPITETETKTTITPEMTPEIPEVGRFVKKEFLWPVDPEDAASDTSG